MYVLYACEQDHGPASMYSLPMLPSFIYYIVMEGYTYMIMNMMMMYVGPRPRPVTKKGLLLSYSHSK